jgi:hypothetical protein
LPALLFRDRFVVPTDKQTQSAQPLDDLDTADIVADPALRNTLLRQQQGQRLNGSPARIGTRHDDEVLRGQVDVVARAQALGAVAVDNASGDHRDLHAVQIHQLCQPPLYARPQAVGRFGAGATHRHQVARQVGLSRSRYVLESARMLATQPLRRHESDHPGAAGRQLLQRFDRRGRAGQLGIGDSPLGQPRPGLGQVHLPTGLISAVGRANDSNSKSSTSRVANICPSLPCVARRRRRQSVVIDACRADTASRLKVRP